MPDTGYGWSKMPNHILHNGFDGRAIALYHALFSHADNTTGRCTVARGTLANQIGL